MKDTKICKKCGRELPLSEFHKQKGTKDGYRNVCKECWQQYYKRWRVDNQQYMNQWWSSQNGRASQLAKNYKIKDKKHSRENNIDAQWIVDNIFSSKCIYCGEDDWRKLGCDRIDNSIGHIIGNVVPCCLKCNNERQKKPFDEFYTIKKGLNTDM